LASWKVEIEGVKFNSRSVEVFTLRVEADTKKEARKKACMVISVDWLSQWDKVYFTAQEVE